MVMFTSMIVTINDTLTTIPQALQQFLFIFNINGDDPLSNTKMTTYERVMMLIEVSWLWVTFIHAK